MLTKDDLQQIRIIVTEIVTEIVSESEARTKYELRTEMRAEFKKVHKSINKLRKDLNLAVKLFDQDLYNLSKFVGYTSSLEQA
jgi:hypothetical protein